MSSHIPQNAFKAGDWRDILEIKGGKYYTFRVDPQFTKIIVSKREVRTPSPGNYYAVPYVSGPMQLDYVSSVSRTVDSHRSKRMVLSLVFWRSKSDVGPEPLWFSSTKLKRKHITRDSVTYPLLCHHFILVLSERGIRTIPTRTCRCISKLFI